METFLERPKKLQFLSKWSLNLLKKPLEVQRSNYLTAHAQPLTKYVYITVNSNLQLSRRYKNDSFNKTHNLKPSFRVFKLNFEKKPFKLSYWVDFRLQVYLEITFYTLNLTRDIWIIQYKLKYNSSINLYSHEWTSCSKYFEFYLICVFLILECYQIK